MVNEVIYGKFYDVSYKINFLFSKSNNELNIMPYI